jgi:hypothetical protein
MLAIVIGAAVIGSLTVFLAMRGGGGDTTTAADAAQLANAPADAGDLPVPDTATPGDALATISVPDAGVEVAIDATAAAIDAAAPLAVDAAVVPADTAKHASVDAQKSALRTAMDEGRYAAAVHECTKTFSSHIAALCTLAACRAGQESRAQRWYPRIPGSSARRGVATSCHSSGIDVIKKRPPPPPKPRDAGVDPCAANPMACPH